MGNTRHRIDNEKPSAFGQARLLYVSTSKYEGDWQSLLHSHPFSELFYVVNGQGTFIAEDTEFPVKKNDMVIINPHVRHTEKSLPGAPLDYIVLGIEGLSFAFEKIAAARSGESAQAPSGTVSKYNVSKTNVCTCLNLMLEEVSRQEEDYETVCQNLLEVLLISMLRSGSAGQQPPLKQRMHPDQKLSGCKLFGNDYVGLAGGSHAYEQILSGAHFYEICRPLSHQLSVTETNTGRKIPAGIHFLFHRADLRPAGLFVTVLFFTGFPQSHRHDAHAVQEARLTVALQAGFYKIRIPGFYGYASFCSLSLCSITTFLITWISCFMESYVSTCSLYLLKVEI